MSLLMTKFYLDLEPAQHARMPADRFDESRGLAAEYVEAERIFQLAPTIPLCSRAAPAAAVRRANTPRPASSVFGRCPRLCAL